MTHLPGQPPTVLRADPAPAGLWTSQPSGLLVPNGNSLGLVRTGGVTVPAVTMPGQGMIVPPDSFPGWKKGKNGNGATIQIVLTSNDLQDFIVMTQSAARQIDQDIDSAKITQGGIGLIFVECEIIFTAAGHPIIGIPICGGGAVIAAALYDLIILDPMEDDISAIDDIQQMAIVMFGPVGADTVTINVTPTYRSFTIGLDEPILRAPFEEEDRHAVSGVIRTGLTIDLCPDNGSCVSYQTSSLTTSDILNAFGSWQSR